MALKKGENGLPCRRLRSGLSEGSAEKREENMLSDGQRRWMRECYFCQKLWLLFSKDFPLMTPPISFIYSHLFSCIALPPLFHFLPPPSRPSRCFASSRFFFSLLSLCELQQKADGASLTSEWAAPSSPWREKRRWRSREQEAEESTPKWWRLVEEEISLFCHLFLESKEFRSIFSHL